MTAAVDEVLAALIRRGGAKRGENGWWNVRCPFHDDRNPSAGFNEYTGAFVCHSARCGRRSNAHELASILQLGGAVAPGDAKWKQYDAKHLRRQNNAYNAKEAAKTQSADFGEVYCRLPSVEVDGATMEHLRSRGLGLEVATYGVRGGDGEVVPRGVLVFPYFDGGRVVGLKYRLPRAEGKLRYRSVRGSSFTVPFGMQTIKKWRLGLLVVEGEINALSCYRVLRQSMGEWRWVDVVSTGSEVPTAALLERLAHVAKGRHCVVWCDSGRIHLPGAHVITSPTDGGVKLDANEMLHRGVLGEFLRSLLSLAIDDKMAEWSS